MALHMPGAVAIIAERLASRRARSSGSLLVALSGSGKGYTANLLHRALERRGIHAALVHADDWLSPPPQRFGSPCTARHFFEKAFQFDAMFSHVVTPLRRDRDRRNPHPRRTIGTPAPAELQVQRCRRRPARGQLPAQARAPPELRPDDLDRLHVQDRARAGPASQPGGAYVRAARARLQDDLLPRSAAPRHQGRAPRAGRTRPPQRRQARARRARQ